MLFKSTPMITLNVLFTNFKLSTKSAINIYIPEVSNKEESSVSSRNPTVASSSKPSFRSSSISRLGERKASLQNISYKVNFDNSTSFA